MNGRARERDDWLAMAACAALAAGAYALTAAHVSGLGDAPEAVAGLPVGAVLHAPGYVLYALAGRAFGTIVPVGDGATRANLMSTVVTVAAVAGVFDIARRLNASRVAAGMAAVGWASTTSVWFYAGYAKHDATSTAWIVLIVWLISGSWSDPSIKRVAVVAGLMGLSLGLGWPPIVSMLPAVIWWGWSGLRRPWGIACAVSAGLGGVALVAGLVFWRSAAEPTSFGGVESLPRLWRLWTLADFGSGADSGRHAGALASLGPIGRVARYGAVIGRDIGTLLGLTGLGGLIVGWRIGLRGVQILTAAALSNLIVVAIVLDAQVWGYRSGIVQGGFVAPITLAIVVGAALGIDWLAGAFAPRLGWTLTWPVLILVLIIPGLALHRAPATQLQAPIADWYARQLLEPLPRRAVVFAGSQSSSYPLLLAQQHGLRPDVSVIAIDGLATDWYRHRAAHELGQDLPPVGPKRGSGVALRLIEDVRPRPVFLDMEAQRALDPRIAYRPIGLSARALNDGQGFRDPAHPAELVDQIASDARRAGADTDPARGRWPNDEITGAYARPILLIAQSALDRGDTDVARKALQIALRLEPENHTVRAALQAMGSGQ